MARSFLLMERRGDTNHLFPELTLRQQQLVDLFCATELGRKEIAFQMGLHVSSLKVYMSKIYYRLNKLAQINTGRAYACDERVITQWYWQRVLARMLPGRDVTMDDFLTKETLIPKPSAIEMGIERQRLAMSRQPVKVHCINPRS